MGVFADLFWNVVRFPVVEYLRKQDQLEASLPQIYISNSTNSGHYSNGIFSNIFSTFWYGVSKRHVTLETRLILIAIFNLLAWKKGKESQLALRDKKPPSAKILFFVCILFMWSTGINSKLHPKKVLLIAFFAVIFSIIKF